MKISKSRQLMLVFIFTISLIIPSTVYAVDNKQVSVIMDNEYIIYDEDYGKPFIDENNRTMVPLRLTLELFGAKVEWDGDANQAILTKGDTVVIVPIGEKYIYKNGEKIENDTYATVIGTEKPRTYTPIRVVMEAFGCEVSWDNVNLTAIIKTNNETLKEEELEVKYDLREEGSVTSVKDQRDIGACWAFAALGSIESNLLKQTGELYDFSEDNVSLKHGYNLTQDEGGDFMLALAYFARWSGPVLESEDIYGDGISNKDAKSIKHLQEAYIIPSKDYETIKKSVKTYGGIHTSIYWEYTDVEDNQFYNNTTYSLNYNGDKIPNHDVVIIGWDDEFGKENFIIQPEGDGAFICKNSFGTDFGEEGYFYISYYDTHIGKHNMVFSGIEDNNNYDKIYQADWLGLVGKLGYNTDTAYFSNVYTTSDVQEELAAVSFYTTGDNSEYEIYVVENFTSKEDLSNMKFTQSGFLEFSGYYTVKLQESINLKKNSKFAVVIKMTTPGTNFPIAAEFDRDVKWLDKVDLSDGEGYISYDATVWEDTEEVLASNVCLKAFTNIVKVNEDGQEMDQPDSNNQQVDEPKINEPTQPNELDHDNNSDLIQDKIIAKWKKLDVLALLELEW